MAYALGKYSKGQCDRCGFVYKYLQLKTEWNGLKVCSECYEPKHPQLDPKPKPADPQAIRNARPETAEFNQSFVLYTNVDKGILGTKLDTYELTVSVGEVTITT